MRGSVLPLPLSAAPAQAACDIAGFATDHDPAGPNIRTASAGPVIGRLPAPVLPAPVLSAPVRRDDMTLPVEFRITEVQGDWVRISAPAFGAYLPRMPRFHFAGPGWVHASLVGLQAGSHRLRTAPIADAPTVVTLRDEDKAGYGWGPDSITITRVHSCRGAFAEVSVTLPNGRQARGWVRNTGSNQVTTGDGSDPDEAEWDFGCVSRAALANRAALVSRASSA